MEVAWRIKQLAYAYIKYFVQFQGVSTTIMSDRDTLFFFAFFGEAIGGIGVYSKI